MTTSRAIDHAAEIKAEIECATSPVPVPGCCTLQQIAVVATACRADFFALLSAALGAYARGQ